MSEERKGILLHLPQEIFEIMKDYKTLSGVSYNNQIYNSIVWWLVSRGLLSIEYITQNSNKKKEKKEEDNK